MSPGSDPFDRSYENEAVNDLIVTVLHCGEKQKEHPAFKENVPEYVTLQPELADLAAKLGTARDDKNMAGQLKALMGQSVRALHNNADHLVKFSQHRNDPSLLDNAGYDLRQESSAAREKINLLDLVPELSVKHMPGVSGVFLAVLKLAKKKAITELQLTETPDVEESWKRYGEGTFNSSRLEIRGQQPAKKIYLRARYHDGGGVGRWSASTSIIVL